MCGGRNSGAGKRQAIGSPEAITAGSPKSIGTYVKTMQNTDFSIKLLFSLGNPRVGRRFGGAKSEISIGFFCVPCAWPRNGESRKNTKNTKTH